ncbi:glycosyltransferase [Massilia arenosa]|uniref:Glycosyltransferase n=1 Tax=Zemynaea arenosa TaxID=2561931 RepID=A0A4Y9SUF2_9BURK|nr:glycosyltransferase [Massilia arenosa]TFW30251.1 glycosyltransferase [Massilia arenosa]
MKLAIDLQGAQLAGADDVRTLALAIAAAADTHEVQLLLNAALPGLADLRTAALRVAPNARVQVLDYIAPPADALSWQARANERVRDFVLATIAPDAIIATGLDAPPNSATVRTSSAWYDRTFALLAAASTHAAPGAAAHLLARTQSTATGQVIAAAATPTDSTSTSTAGPSPALETAPASAPAAHTLADRWQLPSNAVTTLSSDDAQAAGTALEAIAAWHATHPQAAAPRARRKLALVSPLPPERTGIADYMAQCLPALMEWFDIDLILKQSKVDLPEECKDLPQRDVDWFDAHAHEYDQVLYQFGNSPFHSHMFGLLQRHPGVVVLHDFFLSSVLAYEQMTQAMPHVWTDALFHSHGYAAVRAALQPGGTEAATAAYPCNLDVLQGATAVIVHSEHARSMASEWYGPGADRNWHMVPLPRSTPPALDRAAARAALGISADAFVICTFGFVDRRKQSHRLLDAFLASPLAQDPRCELVFVGSNHADTFGNRMVETIRNAGLGQRIRIAGWTDEPVYQQYLQAADVGVQLRSQSRGETSAAVLDCMNYGLPTIVNASGSMAALPNDAVVKLAEEFETSDLSDALTALYRDAERRATLSQNALAVIAREHRPEHAARTYAQVLDETLAVQDQTLPALLRDLAAIVPQDDDSVRAAGALLATTGAPLPRPRQLLVDVTNIVRHDLGTGIERVVRMQLLELLAQRATGLRVEAVYLSSTGGRWHNRYAPQYCCRILGMEQVVGVDAPVDLLPGDILYAPDYEPAATVEAARAGVYANLRARGVQTAFLIHDLLPVLRPEFFPPGADARHATWLDTIHANADRLVCISDAVRQEAQAWFKDRPNSGDNAPAYAVVHHGADLGQAPAPTVAGQADAELLARMGKAPCFLMVGTIEPRKGHLQALDAFEQLWREGVNAHLVIVGREGWRGLPDDERRTIPRIMSRLREHHELDKRLFWLDGVSDAVLEQVYRQSTCLLAPSEGEGFGLPLIEAAHHGLPVLARGIPVFREVGGTAAAYFEGDTGADLAHAIRTWLDDFHAARHPKPEAMGSITWRENAQRLLAALTGH